MVEVAEPVFELTGTEPGSYLVRTTEARHVISGNARTVARMMTNLDLPASVLALPLRNVVRCRVGETAVWALHSDLDADGFPHRTSPVLSITRLE